MRTPISRLLLRSAIALAAAITVSNGLGPVQRVAAADAPDCYVSFELSLTSVGRGSQVQYVDVLADCSVNVRAPEQVKAGGPDTFSSGPLTCRLINRLHGIPGTWDTLTELTTYSTWYYDGSTVTSQWRNHGHWEQAVTGWYLTSGPSSWQAWYAPASYVPTSTDAYFANGSGFGWAHRKFNQVNVYGNGTCNGSYAHEGWVCGGCGVVAYLDVY